MLALGITAITLMAMYVMGLVLWVNWMYTKAMSLLVVGSIPATMLADYEVSLAHTSPMHWIRTYRKYSSL